MKYYRGRITFIGNGIHLEKGGTFRLTLAVKLSDKVKYIDILPVVGAAKNTYLLLLQELRLK